MIELTPKNQDLLNVSRFNNLIKIQRLSDLKNKTRPNYTLLTTDTKMLKVKGYKTICHEDTNQKKAGLAKLLPDKPRLTQEVFPEIKRSIL